MVTFSYFFFCLLQVATQADWALYKSTFTSTFPYIVAIQLVGLIREWRYHSLEIDHFFPLTFSIDLYSQNILMFTM